MTFNVQVLYSIDDQSFKNAESAIAYIEEKVRKDQSLKDIDKKIASSKFQTYLYLKKMKPLPTIGKTISIGNTTYKVTANNQYKLYNMVLCNAWEQYRQANDLYKIRKNNYYNTLKAVKPAVTFFKWAKTAYSPKIPKK